MKLSELIQEVRNRINDKDGVGDFDNDQLISFINQAVLYLGSYFITAANPLCTKELILADGDTLPSDFIKACGTFPMTILGRTVSLYNPKKTLTIRYFSNPAKLTALTDELPYKDDMSAMVIVNLAVIFALNQQKFNVQQDQAISTEIMKMINTAYGYTQ